MGMWFCNKMDLLMMRVITPSLSERVDKEGNCSSPQEWLPLIQVTRWCWLMCFLWPEMHHIYHETYILSLLSDNKKTDQTSVQTLQLPPTSWSQEVLNLQRPYWGPQIERTLHLMVYFDHEYQYSTGLLLSVGDFVVRKYLCSSSLHKSFQVTHGTARI